MKRSPQLSRRAAVLGLALAASCLVAGRPRPATDLPGSGSQLFLSPQVRPVALSGDGVLVYAVNTNAGTLAILEATPPYAKLAEVRVGLEPVGVAVRPKLVPGDPAEDELVRDEPRVGLDRRGKPAPPRARRRGPDPRRPGRLDLRRAERGCLRRAEPRVRHVRPPERTRGAHARDGRALPDRDACGTHEPGAPRPCRRERPRLRRVLRVRERDGVPVVRSERPRLVQPR